MTHSPSSRQNAYQAAPPAPADPESETAGLTTDSGGPPAHEEETLQHAIAESMEHTDHGEHLSTRSQCIRIWFCLFGIFSFMILIATSQKWITKPAHHPSTHWSYQGELGPHHWGMIKEYYETCNTGAAQSPVNIAAAAAAAPDGDRRRRLGDDEAAGKHDASGAAAADATLGSLLSFPEVA